MPMNLAERLAWTASKLAAMGLLVVGRREDALERFSAMLRRWPNDAYALASRAHLQAQAGRRGEALADLGALVAHHPGRSAADWFNLAFLLDEDGRLDEAEAAFRRAVELQPMSPYGWYQLARVQMDRRQPDEARKILRHLNGFEPKVAAQLSRETGLAV